MYAKHFKILLSTKIVIVFLFNKIRVYVTVNLFVSFIKYLSFSFYFGRIPQTSKSSSLNILHKNFNYVIYFAARYYIT